MAVRESIISGMKRDGVKHLYATTDQRVTAMAPLTLGEGRLLGLKPDLHHVQGGDCTQTYNTSSQEALETGSILIRPYRQRYILLLHPLWPRPRAKEKHARQKHTEAFKYCSVGSRFVGVVVRREDHRPYRTRR